MEKIMEIAGEIQRDTDVDMEGEIEKIDMQGEIEREIERYVEIDTDIEQEDINFSLKRIPEDEERCTRKSGKKKSGKEWRCSRFRKLGSNYCEKHLENRLREKEKGEKKMEMVESGNDDQRCVRTAGKGWRCKGVVVEGGNLCEKHQKMKDSYNSMRNEKRRILVENEELEGNSKAKIICQAEVAIERARSEAKAARDECDRIKKEFENFKSSSESSYETLKKEVENEVLQKDIMKTNLEEALKKVSALQTDLDNEVAKAKTEGEVSGSKKFVAELPYWINKGFLFGHVSVLKKQGVPRDDPRWYDVPFPYPSQAPPVEFDWDSLGIP